MRACWTPPDAIPDDEAAPRRVPVAAVPVDTGARVPRTFVPVDELVVVTPSPSPSGDIAPPKASPVAADPAGDSGWSLWAEPSEG